jgi:hypothetical protein
LAGKKEESADEDEDEDYENTGFEDDAGADDDGDDKLERLRRALDKENQKAVKYQ